MPHVGILLAAGHSRRFGEEDKLLADVGRQALVSYTARALLSCGLDHNIAVIRNPALRPLLEGFDIVTLPMDDGLQSASLGAGVRRARALNAQHVLIALGDMPAITPQHLRNVMACGLRRGQSCSGDGQRRLPPASFSTLYFDALCGLSGDSGAGVLLRAMPPVQVVETTAQALRDIDTPQDIPAGPLNST